MSRYLLSLLLLIIGCAVGAAALQMVRHDVPGPGFVLGFAVLLGYIAGQVDR